MPCTATFCDCGAKTASSASSGAARVDGAVLSPAAFVLRYFGTAGDDRVLVVNLGTDLWLSPAPEPLLAPPDGRCWQLRWSSEDPAYGGSGIRPLAIDENWTIPGHSAFVLVPQSARQAVDDCRLAAKVEPGDVMGENGLVAAGSARMRELIRKMPWGEAQVAQLEPLLTREWLITNGLGGYASGTVAGVVTRRYHGLLIAALPAPLGRMMLLPQLSEQIRLGDGRNVRFSGEERTGSPLTVYGANYLAEFRLETGLPVWRYQIGELVLEKRVLVAPPAEHGFRDLPLDRRAGPRSTETSALGPVSSA